MRVIGYIRVSTEEQAAEGISLENQRRKIEAYCEIYNHELLETIEDAGLSAKGTNRAGFQRLLALTAARRPDIEGIIIYKLDRLFRNAEEALRFSSQWDKRGIALISVLEQLDTKSAMGKFFFTLLAAVAEMERKMIGERTSAALQHKKQMGQRAGNIPYGSRLGVDGVMLEDEPAECKIICHVKILKEDGLSTRKIAAALNRRGFKTRRGSPWKCQYIMGILKVIA